MNDNQIVMLPPWPQREDVFTRYGVDTRTAPQQDNCLFEKDGVGLISRGDVHLCCARPKAGKTSFVWALVEAARRGEALGFRVADGALRCLVCDTEMAVVDIVRKANSLEAATQESVHNETQDPVRILRLRRPDRGDERAAQLPAHEWRLRTLEAALLEGEFDLVVVDGVHDFCADVMDNTAAIATSRALQALAEEYACAILCVLHLNPKGPGETRGHLGSQLQRDCADFFRLECKTDAVGAQYVRVAHELESRHRQVSPTYFVFGENGEAIPFTPTSAAAGEAEQLRQSMRALFDGHPQRKAGELREEIMQENGVSSPTAERWIKKSLALGITTQPRRGVYALSAATDFANSTFEDVL